MAKDNVRDDDELDNEIDESSLPLSPESLKAITSARKGKVHYFVLIRKGARVGCLVVFKRGEFNQHIKDAKDVCTGTAFYGTVTGSGNQIAFQLSKADGFDKAPVKKKILRDFLNEHAGLALVVSFEIK